MPLLKILIILLALSGCISINVTRQVRVMPGYKQNEAVIARLKSIAPTKVSVGGVQPTDENDPANDLSVRGAKYIAPAKTFAKFFENNMIGDLSKAGIYDPKAETRIDLTILKNDIATAVFTHGQETLNLHVKIVRKAQVLLDKDYSKEIRLESHITGGAAGDAAQAEYANLVQQAFAQIYGDPEFLKALTANVQVNKKIGN